jgi:hypothetical protein
MKTFSGPSRIPRHDAGIPIRLLFVACLTFLNPAHGAERQGDAAFVDSYQHHAGTELAVENEILFLIAIAPDEERFNLYWTHNHLIGAWLQVELLQEQLALAVVADSAAEEDETRATLRDQAQFALWELALTEVALEGSTPELGRPDHLQINRAIRELLFEVRSTVRRLLFDQCARLLCATGF